MNNSFAAFLNRRRIVLVVMFALAVLILPFIFKHIQPSYTATSHVFMTGSGAVGSWMPSGDMGNLATSKTVVARVAERFSLGSDLASVAGRVDAKVPHSSNVMPISFHDKNQALALEVTNALADETVAYYKELSSGQYDRMIAYLLRQAGETREKIHSVDLRLQAAAQKDTYVGSEFALDTVIQHVGDLQTQRSGAYAALVSSEAIAAAQSAQPKEIAGIVHHEVLANDPFVQALRTGHATDAAQLEFVKAKYTQRFPGLPGLKDQVAHESASLSNAELKAAIGAPSSSASYAASVLAIRNANAVAAGDRARLHAIDADISAERNHLHDLAGTTVSVLRAERAAEQAAYGSIIGRLTQTRADQAAASSIGSLVVLDHAFDSKARLPRIAMDLLVTFILMALTFGFAYAIDVLDPALRSPAKIEKLYGIPLISNIGSKR